VDDFSRSRQCWPYAPGRRALGRSSVMAAFRFPYGCDIRHM
jgi:hypothetical protein